MPTKYQPAPRPCKKYDPARTPTLARALANLGMIEDEIAKYLDVAQNQIVRWRLKYPDFAEALKGGKAPVDDSVEKSLLQRALGYEYEEVKVIGEPDKDGKMTQTRVEKTKRHVSPDVTACIFWLKNRRRSEWNGAANVEFPEGLQVQFIMPPTAAATAIAKPRGEIGNGQDAQSDADDRAGIIEIEVAEN